MIQVHKFIRFEKFVVQEVTVLIVNLIISYNQFLTENIYISKLSNDEQSSQSSAKTAVNFMCEVRKTFFSLSTVTMRERTGSIVCNWNSSTCNSQSLQSTGTKYTRVGRSTFFIWIQKYIPISKCFRLHIVVTNLQYRFVTALGTGTSGFLPHRFNEFDLEQYFVDVSMHWM